MAHLYRVLVPVGDVEKAAGFYGALLGEEGRRVSPGRHYFDCEGTILACFDSKIEDGYEARPLPEPIYLAVDDLPATFAACRDAGAAFDPGSSPQTGPLGEIAKRPWGEESFYVRDPWDNPLCFVAQDSVFRG